MKASLSFRILTIVKNIINKIKIITMIIIIIIIIIIQPPNMQKESNKWYEIRPKKN